MKQKIILAVLVIATIALSYAISPVMPYITPASGIWKHSLSVEHPEHKEIVIPELHNTVRIERDIHGIPHIFAENDHDLFFALGYVHAQDRLFQIDLQRRLPSGRLAEIVGEDGYASDTFYRTLGMHRAAQKSYQEMSLWAKEILDIYCQGVNHYINTDSHPLEYTLLQSTPQEYTPVDALTFGKMMGWELSGNFYDLEFQKLEEALGSTAANELFPSQYPVEIPIIPGLSKACQEILIWSNQQAHIPLKGSNNWVVSPKKSQSGTPMLCNDPHLSTTLPSLWYQVHMVSPNYNVTGVTLAGTPCVLIGKNPYIAWGLTNVGADVIDFYVETFSEDKTKYLYKGEWLDIKTVKEEIDIKGKDSRTISVDITRHGPVLERDNKEFAVSWTGLDATREFEALLLINKATNYQEYKKGLQLFSVAAQNFVYADVYGNIAIRSTGKIPIRNKGTGRIPVDGASGEYEWTGYIPFEELPHSFNPDQGFLASANQVPITGDYPYYLGFLWADRYRAERINTFLQEKDVLTMEDMMALQSDLYDIPASIIAPMVVETIDPQNELEKKAIKYLEAWDYLDERTQIAPTIFHTFLEHLKENTFKDEYTTGGIPDTMFPSTETVETMLKGCGTINFFDDVTTSKEETKNDMIKKSFSDAVNELKNMLGKDITKWQYSKRHIFSLEHLIGSVVGALNYPQFGYDGSPHTVDMAGGWVSKGGPSWRQITNFETSWCIYPGGQVDNPFSKHYTDFVELWKESQYIPWVTKEYQIESVLILKGD